MIDMPEEGTHDLAGRIVENGETTELACKVTYRRVNEMLRFAEISTDKIDVPAGSKAEVEFVSGDLRFAVPFTVF